MTKPAPMVSGSKIGIVALAGPMEVKTLLAGEKYLNDLGFEVLIAPSCFEANGFLAGEDDAARGMDLMMMFADDDVGLILNMRGGYGSNRIMPYISDFNFKRYPKPFVGYSDITYIHLYLNQKHGLITYHGPMIKDLLKENKTTVKSFLHTAVLGEGFQLLNVDYLQKPHTPMESEVVGGNLSIVASTLGTPYEIDTRHKILFLEEVDEAPYSVDRLLYQLIYAGKLQHCAGFILGDFKGEKEAEIEKVLASVLLPFKKPIAWRLLAGHCNPNITLPLGGRCIMDGAGGTLTFIN